MPRAYVTYSREDGVPRAFDLDDAGDVVRIGRNEDADIALPWDHRVSRWHADLVRVGDGWAIVDDGISTNGTQVNGLRVAGRRRLSSGDEIDIGSVRVTFRALDDEGVRTRIDADDLPPVVLSDAQRKVLVALCRPYRDDTGYGTPATNQAIADELFLSVAAVKTHLRILFGKFAIGDLAQNQKRVRLVELAFQRRLVRREDLFG